MTGDLTSPSGPAQVAAGTAPLMWTCHPLRDEPLPKSLALIGLIAVASAAMATSLEEVLYGLIAAVFLLTATMGYFLPTTYALDAKGVASRQLVWRRRPWSAFRRVTRLPEGLFLGPLRQPSRLDSFRGIFLRFGPTVDGARIEAMVRSHVAD